MILPKYRTIAGKKVKIQKDNADNGGSFDSVMNEIVIGTKDSEEGQLHTFLHEVCEGIMALRNFRYSCENREPDNGDYLFSFNHKEFEVFCSDLTKALEGFEYKGKK